MPVTAAVSTAESCAPCSSDWLRATIAAESRCSTVRIRVIVSVMVEYHMSGFGVVLTVWRVNCALLNPWANAWAGGSFGSLTAFRNRKLVSSCSVSVPSASTVVR